MTVHNLTVRRGHVNALEDVSLDTAPGRITAIVGGDGAGKTTLLEAMVGLVVPQAGTVDTPARARIGYMPAGDASWLDLTVDENVTFVAGSYGLTGDALARRADDVLSRAGLLDARDRLAGRLSGGMRKKLGFCLAVLHEPDLLILDEPSTGVDPVSRVQLWRMISEAAARGTAVVMTTTYLDEAERAAQIVLLERGRALLTGTPEQMVAACPGDVVATRQPRRLALAWRDGDGYREWWPDGAPSDLEPATVTLEDVAIIASLQAETAS